MKSSITVAITAVLLVGGAMLTAQQQAPPTAPAPAAAPASTMAGKWSVNLESPQGATTMALDVKVDAANKVTGTIEGPQGPSAIKGEVKDGVLGFTMNVDAGGTALEIYVEGKLNAEGKMTGTLSVGDMGSFPFVATRVKN